MKIFRGFNKNNSMDLMVHKEEREFGISQDITNRNISNNMLLEKLPQLYNNPDIGIWSVNMQTGQTLYSSNGVKHICGYSTDDLNNGTMWLSIVHPDDLSQFIDNQYKYATGNILSHQYRILHKNGDVKWVQDYTIPKLDADGKLLQLDGLTLDITKQKALHDKVKYLTNYDHLTNLPNREKFYEKLQLYTDEYAENNKNFAVLIFDMDRFKYINDTLGHQIGDELLKQISTRISTHLTADDLLARSGGDEFSVLIGKMESIESLKNVVDNIIESLREPFLIDEYQLYITASVGISTFPENGESGLELMRSADLALYKAQKAGKNNYKIISPSNNIDSYKSFSIGLDIRKAIDKNELTLYYQPRVDTFSNKLMSAEALIRWEHREWGLIYPKEFLSIAEENGLITYIDNWVFKEVCNQIRKWKTEQKWMVPISINISSANFMTQNWPQRVIETIQEAGISPQDIVFEMTERSLLDVEEMAIKPIHLLREYGIKVCLNEFGQGSSSLAYLTRFPFDVINIDKMFIKNMIQSEKDLLIVKTILQLAKGLQVKVVAAGVETLAQLKILKQEGCDEVQGYLFSRPVPSDEFVSLLQNKMLQPIDSKLKAKQSKRRYYRIHFPYPLGADMTLLSISGRLMKLGKSSILIEDLSVGGLRFISTLNLPVRNDMIFHVETHILGETIQMNGYIVWKEEMNNDLIEYGVEFIIRGAEQAALTKLLNTFDVLLRGKSILPEYNIVKEDRYQYFQKNK